MHDLVCITCISCLQPTIMYRQLAHRHIFLGMPSINALTQNYCITEEISFTCKGIQWIIFIDHFHPSGRKYCSCYLHICEVIYRLSYIKDCVSTENTLVHIYKHTFIPVSYILHSSVCYTKKKVSICVSFHIHFKMKWKKLPLQGIFIGEAYNLLWLHKSKCSHAAKYG